LQFNAIFRSGGATVWVAEKALIGQSIVANELFIDSLLFRDRLHLVLTATVTALAKTGTERLQFQGDLMR
jgi:hypothetical protein